MRINNTAWNRIRYSVYAPFYNIIRGLFSGARERSIKLGSLVKGEKILLVGAGTGLDFDYLPKDVEITAIDLSPQMVARAEVFARSKGHKAKFEVMDAENLTYRDQEFDCIILHLILAVVPDPESCAKEVSRVLKNNGRILILDKFLPDNQKATLLRRIFNLLTTFLFSDINRHLGPILEFAKLKTACQENSVLGGAFKITVAEKMK
ncbi:MAG: class I SAM-dependent methyltransferase [Proteobacteria bacterium]|nr:class I SAM-dependent methyltransferase [Pseudomonadota bacterium]